MTTRAEQGTHPVGQVLHATYRIERLIGQGGLGAVYEASHLRLVRRFAIKMLTGVGASPDDLVRFKREALITSALGHPHILEVIDFNQTEEGVPYLVMELLDGEDLARRLQRVERLPLGQTARIFQQVASALEAVHQRGIVHRDLKPHNIFLCRRGARDDFVKVVDFGACKVLGWSGLTTSRAGLPGTPNYMSPEQVEQRHEAMDPRSDVYAAATVLFVMLTGHPPFRADTNQGVLAKIVRSEPPPLRGLNAAIPESIAAVVAKGMRKNPEDRHPSMRAFWEAFAQALRQEGIELPAALEENRAGEDPGRTEPPAPPPIAELVSEASEGPSAPALDGPTQPFAELAARAPPSEPTLPAAASAHPARRRPWWRRRVWAGVAIGVALAVGATAVKLVRDRQVPAADPTRHTHGAAGDLLVLVIQPVGTLDPAYAHTHEEANVINQTHEGLLRYDAARGVVEPALATSWRREGSTTFFELRPNVRFHDGSPLTAAAVARSLRRSQRPRWGRSLLWDVEAITTPGPMTVAIRLARPSASLLVRLCTHTTLVTAEGGAYPNGTGPFRVLRWNREVGAVTLGPNPGYWGGAPRLRSVTFRAEPDGAARASLMVQGDAQIGMALPPEAARAAERHREIAVLRSARFMSLFLSFNTEKPYLGDPAVRRALALAVDRAALVRELYGDTAAPATGSVPPTLHQHRPGSAVGFDPEAARRALAGTPVASRTLSLYLWRSARPYLPDPARAGRLLARSFAAVGLKAEPHLVSFDELDGKICKQGLHDMVVLGWSPSYPDPENIYWLLTPEGLSCARFADPAFRDLFRQVSSELDLARRDRLFSRIEALIAERQPWLPLANIADQIVVRSEVRGYRYGFSFVNLLWLKNAYLVDARAGR
jgi:serine/threonine-protein kinase